MSKNKNTLSADQAIAQLWPRFVQGMQLLAEAQPLYLTHSATGVALMLRAEHPRWAKEIRRLVKTIQGPQPDLRTSLKQLGDLVDRREAEAWLRRQFEALEDIK